MQVSRSPVRWHQIRRITPSGSLIPGTGLLAFVTGVGLYDPVSVNEVIEQLPAIEIVRARSKAMAMLDAVMSPEWEWRYYSYDAHWSSTEEMASMRDGSGNDYAIVFSEAGVYAQVCSHESPITACRVSPPKPWTGLFDSVPDLFRRYVHEPAFADHSGLPRATACLWRKDTDSSWSCGDVHVPDGDDGDADGAQRLLGLLLGGTAEAYRQFAEEYWQMEPDLHAVRRVYDLEPLTQDIVASLNRDVRLEQLAEDIAEIGYPAQ